MTETDAKAKPTFEQALSELEEVVGKLEAGKLALEESLSLFERGQVLSAYCGKLLDNAELKITRITPEGEAPLTLTI